MLMQQPDNLIRGIVHNFENVHFLQNESFELTNDVVIIGTTLWSKVPTDLSDLVSYSMNDYTQIYNDNNYLITPEEINVIHDNNINQSRQLIDKNYGKKIVMVSHHLPSFQLINPQYIRHPLIVVLPIIWNI